MKYVLRIKATSECIGIRRAALCYCVYGNGVVDLKNQTHPVGAFGEIEICDDVVKVNDEEVHLQIAQEERLSFGRKVESSSGEIYERIDLKLMVLPLVEELVDTYKKAIEDKMVFDSWDGEFEYLLGMIYELTLNEPMEASKYYYEAKKKRFNFELIRKSV